jgi:hypothetical protein
MAGCTLSLIANLSACAGRIDHPPQTRDGGVIIRSRSGPLSVCRSGQGDPGAGGREGGAAGEARREGAQRGIREFTPPRRNGRAGRAVMRGLCFVW